MDSTTTTDEDVSAHLTVIIDLNPTQWHLSAEATNDHPMSLSQFLSQLLVFVNAHLAGKDDNTLALIGAFPGFSQILYRTGDEANDVELPIRHHANSYQPFRMVNANLTRRIQEEMDKTGDSTERGDKALVGAITKALCHINRIIHPTDSTVSETPAPGAKVATTANPRLLILSVSPDLSTSYIPLMNSIFAAQKMKVKIDVCKIFGQDTVFLQQASYLTGGAYISLERRDAMLQYLTMCFLPSSGLRKILATPTQDRVDFRAACFCHNDIVDIGYVCSVCLSIFCKYRFVCSTCRTKFPIKKLPGKGPAALQANGQRNGSSTPTPSNGQRIPSATPTPSKA